MDRRSRALIAGGVLTLLAVIGWTVSPDLVLDRIEDIAADPVHLAVVLCLLAIVRPALAWPTTLLALLAGYGYGLVGIPIALGLLVVTGIPPFLLARHGRAAWVGIDDDPGRAGAVVARFAHASDRVVATTGAVRGVTAARLFPVPSDLISIGAGLANIRLFPFVVGTALGEAPWAFIGAVAGASVERLTRPGGTTIVDPWLVVAMFVTGVLLLVGPVYKRFRTDPAAPHPGGCSESEDG